MTSTTESLPAADAISVPVGGRVRGAWRFAIAFIVGLAAALALGAAALYAYGTSYADRVLPGVRVGGIDVSGLSAPDAAARLRVAYAALGAGSVVLDSPVGQLTIPYSDIGRGPDADAMAAEALGVGRSGSPVERAVAEAQTALWGVTVQPRVTVDTSRLSARLSSLVSRIQQPPGDAAITVSKTAFAVIPSQVGRTVDDRRLSQELLTALGSVSAPPTIRLTVPVAVIAPTVDDAEVAAARAVAERMVTDLTLTSGTERWAITAGTIRSWIRFAPTADGGYAPSVDAKKVRSALGAIAKSADRSPRNATFMTGKSGKIVGVAAGRNGRTLDVNATAAAVTQALSTRAAGGSLPSVSAIFATTRPKFTTEDARKSAPLMKKISSWTTYFPVWSRNAFGANIWLPALAIDGTVVAPGEMFDFWQAVGPVTRARGYGLGGAIIDGRTDPQGALGGGICSCSTTLFNAALRAGFEMHARRNHFYYIDRYPVGLDATVFISSGGGVQTMSWRNDTAYPVLIRGFKIRDGNKGYVRFDLYSVPTGRKVVIGAPVIKNVRPASDSTQYTASLPKGVTQRIESPTDGMDVWRTVTVYENGNVIRRTTYYSHYSRITGVLLVGTGG